MNYLYPYSKAVRAEETIPSMTYRQLLSNLGRLTDGGVLTPDNPITMLVAARIVDRTRIVRSGVDACEVRRALEAYRSNARAVPGIVKALEQALETAPGSADC